MGTIDPNALIEQYLEPNPNRPGSADWRVKGRGVSVWALIGYLQGPVAGNVEETARAYEVPASAVEAALAYYDRHREIIDARLAANTV